MFWQILAERISAWLRRISWRELDKLASTEFTFTRFLIPALTNYKGWALFCDSDVVFLNDVKELFDQADDKYAVTTVLRAS